MSPSVVSGLAFVLRESLGAFFLVWGVGKLRNLGSFRRAIEEYRIVGPRAAAGAAPVVASSECAVGLFLMLGFLSKPSALAGAVLLLVFMSAISINLLQGRRIACGCRAHSEELISPKHIVRNALLLTALIVVVWAPIYPWSIDG